MRAALRSGSLLQAGFKHFVDRFFQGNDEATAREVHGEEADLSFSPEAANGNVVLL